MGKSKEKRQVIRSEKEIGEVLAWAEAGAKEGLAFERGVLQALQWATGRTDERPDKAESVEPIGSKDEDDPDEDDFV